MTEVFEFKRPEKNPWTYAAPIALSVVAAWMIFDRKDEPRMFHWIWLTVVGWLWWRSHRKQRKLPNLCLEIDDQEIRLLPSSHWGLDPIPRSSVNDVREERSSMFVLYKRNGNDKAIELERHFFEKAAWQQLLELLQPLPSKKSADPAAGIR